MLNGQQKTIARFHWNENDKTYNDLVEKIQVEGKTKVHVSLAFADEIKGMDLKMKGERLL